MSEEIKDTGFGNSFQKSTKRIINSDGTYNIIRKGANIKWKDAYKYLTETSWLNFFGILFSFYAVLNLLFTILYWCFGIENIAGIDMSKNDVFMQAYYFSVQTFTTVGYGVMSPTGFATQMTSSIEAFIGFLSFSLATGLLYGRFSKPTSKLIFSKNALVSNYKEGKSLQFKIVNSRDNVLLDVSAKMILIQENVNENGQFKKTYFQLPLEISELSLLPLSWTIVHPIDEKSPLFNKNNDELKSCNSEILVLINAFDEVFSQQINVRRSYHDEEILWGKKFKPIFAPDSNGNIVLELKKINDLEDE